MSFRSGTLPREEGIDTMPCPPWGKAELEGEARPLFSGGQPCAPHETSALLLRPHRGWLGHHFPFLRAAGEERASHPGRVGWSRSLGPRAMGLSKRVE